jgi:hypothetical protein
MFIADKTTDLTLTGAEAPSKPIFSARSLEMLISSINADPALLERPWREVVCSGFRLSTEQARSLVEVTPERVEEIQTWFREAARHIRQGAVISGAILTLSPAEQRPGIAHEVQLLIESPIVPTTPVPRMLRIAHCDANCGNWQWNSF